MSAAAAAGRAVVATAVAVAAFVAVAAMLRALVPWPDEAGLAVRMRHFRAHADQYDLVFVGSSNVWRSFDPRVFDARLAELGHPLRSFNLGADNMHPVEVDHVVRRILALRPARLRWIAIEVLRFDPAGMIRGNEFTDRVVYWHEPRSTALAIQRVFTSAAPLRERLRLSLVHLQHAAWRLANLGQGDRIVQGLREAAPTSGSAAAAMLEASGFEPIDAHFQAAAFAVRRRFLAGLPAYRARLAEIDAANAAGSWAPADDSSGSFEGPASLRAHGLELLSVIPPIADATPELYRLGAAGELPNLIGLNAPARYPDLYATESRYDGNHVNGAGAAVASRILADRFAELLDAVGQP